MVLLAAAAAVALVSPASGVTRNPATGFTPAANPGAVWRYGYTTTLGGALTTHVENGVTGGLDFWRTNLSIGVPRVAHNGTTATIAVASRVIGAGELSLHPGPGGEFSVIRFTAPAAQNARVAGSFFGQDSAGTTTDVHILKNGNTKFDGVVNGFGPGSAVPFDLPITLAAGDTLDFVVGYGANANFANDSTGLAATIKDAPVVINSSAITNYTGYIIPSDLGDGDPTTNRQRIHTDDDITFVTSGDYRIDWALIDPADVAVATDTETVLGASASQIFHGNIVPSSATPLVPGRLYRLRVNVVELATGSVVATITRPGRTYIHFTGTVSNSPQVNVVGEITAVTVGRDWLLETDPTRQKIPVTVDYTFYRYDDWAGASTGINVLGNLVPTIRRESDGAVLPSTVTDGGFGSLLLPSYAAGAPKTPAIVSGSRTILVDPADILAPDDYRIQAMLEHIEEPERLLEMPPVFIGRTDNTASSDPIFLTHFSGALAFGDIAAQVSHLASPPTVFVPFPGPFPAPPVLRLISPAADSLTINGRGDYHFDGGTSLVVSVAENGDATYNSDGSAPNGAPGYADVVMIENDGSALVGSVSGIDFERDSDVTLDGRGATGSVSAVLPSGIGWATNRKTNMLDSHIKFGDSRLNQDLQPIGPLLTASFASGSFFLCEETKPVFIQTTSLIWKIAQGEFNCGDGTAHSIRKPLLDVLTTYAADLTDPAAATKRSNDHLYNSVSTATDVTLRRGDSGGGEMSATLASGPGEFLTHFPYDSKVKWTGGSSIKITGDLIDTAASALFSADPLLMAYSQHCQERVETGCGGEKLSSFTFTPASQTLHFTADGGLQATGTTSSPDNLAWGYNLASGNFAHSVATAFTSGNFLMAGTFLRGDQNALEDEDGASVLLLSGFDPGNLATAERPLTPAYAAGLADYAGVNLRCSPGVFAGESTLQETPYGPYPLTARSKYYARLSGVTGIHEAMAGGFPGSATLAGYHFNFTKYGFSFLSNEQEDSLTTGDIDLPAPVDFTLPFKNLRLSCVGVLEGVEVTGAGEVDSKSFAFWNAPFTPYTCNFVSGTGCIADDTTMVLGFSAHASHFDTPFAGSLGIKPNGGFATELDAAAGIVAADAPTRLTLPALLEMTGTTGETYTFFPAQGAYLNAAAGASAGFWSLFGTLDVPFFEDMEVHLHTSAAADETLSPIYMMGGWPTKGWKDPAGNTPFEFVLFDLAHTGRPLTTSLDAYRKTTDNGTDQYLPRAQKLWLGVLDFDYPLKWSNTAFNFQSRGPVQSDLLHLIETQHELTFLDARSAEISFGARYDGLPEISLSNFVFNAVDDTTGVASALVSAAGDEVVGALENGVDEFGNTLSDEADKLLGRAVEAAIDLPVDGLVAAVKAQLADGEWTQAEIDAAVAAYRLDANNRIDTALINLGAASSNPKSLVFDLDQRLAKIELGIDAVTGSSIPPVNGLLKKVSSGGEPVHRAVFEVVGAALVDSLSDVASASVANELNALIADQDPTFDSVTTALTDVRAVISSLRSELQGGTGFGAEIRDIIALAVPNIAAFSDSVDMQIDAIFAAVKAEDVAAVGALDSLAGEWNAAIVQLVKDELYAQLLTGALQTSVRERLYDLQGAFNGAVDTAFAALNQAIRDALSPVLAELDDSITQFSGGLNDKLGAGSLAGAAHINGDSLDRLRLDATLELKVPDALTLAGFIEVSELDSDGPESCGGDTGEMTVEVEVGALDVPIGWTGLKLGDDTRADLSIKAAFTSGFPTGLGGSVELTQGSISFETFKITELAATAMFSVPDSAQKSENYLGAVVGLDFGPYALAGGVFFGRACSLEPIEMIDPLVASILPAGSFTGVYAYGEATFPIYGTGTCFFNISAKAGAGVFYAAEGPTYGGRLSLGIYGEALCAVSVGGEIDLVGAKTGNTYAFAGQGRVFGEAGVCPFCVNAKFHCDFHYTDSSGWKVDF